MSISNNKTGVLINMDKELKDQLAQLAKADNRSLTNYIITVLTDHIKQQEKSISPERPFKW